MMTELLEYIDKGGMTLAQIAREMGIDREELHSRVHMLERAGYIEEVSTASKDCTTRCSNCPISSMCHDDSAAPRYLLITEKGKGYLKAHH